MQRSCRSWVAAAGLVVGIVGGACNSSTPEADCRRSSGAELCLNRDGNSYELQGSGFRSNSELVVVVDGNESRAMTLPVDGSGAAPGPGVVSGFLAGSAEQRVTVNGTSSTGAATNFDFVVPAASR